MVSLIVWAAVLTASVYYAFESEYFKNVWRYGLIPLLILGIPTFYWSAIIAWFIVITVTIFDMVKSKELPSFRKKS